MPSQRQYEVIVFGATGYTGKYTAEHIATNFPSNFEWAIAGRSEKKLKAVVDEIHALNADRVAPGIEIAELNKADLVKLAKKTKVLISTVGPYHQYGTAVVEACVETGTHYVDCTGETPWVYDMINRYQAQAKQTGAILVPQDGIESAPPDLICWMLATHIRRTLNVGTAEIVECVHDLKSAPSGGTLLTVLTLLDSYSLLHLAKSMKPWSITATTPPKQTVRKGILESLTGMRIDSDLGILASSISGPTDLPIIYRSWGLYDQGRFYGSKFHVSPFMRTKSRLMALAIHFGLMFGMIAIALPPVRWLLKRFVYQPGDGPTKEQVRHDYAEWRAIANADVADPNDPKRAYARIRYDGSMYKLTGVCIAEAAYTLARSKTQAHELGGGFATPASLGAPYLERLQKAGFKTEVKIMP